MKLKVLAMVEKTTPVSAVTHSSAIKTVTACFYESLVPTDNSTWRHMSEQQLRHRKLQFYRFSTLIFKNKTKETSLKKDKMQF